jgi:hypothetical protein
MAQTETHRPSADRREQRRGGRRSTDPPATQATHVQCPSCRGMAMTEDLQKRLWEIPGALMKDGQPHVLPISPLL